MLWLESDLKTLLTHPSLKLKLLIACIGGGLLPFAMAPYSFWPVSILGLVLIGLSLRNTSASQAVAIGFASGLALFGVGVNWVYVAIAQFGGSSSTVALTLTILFITGLAAVFAAPFYFYGRFLSRHLMGQTLGFAALWVLGEWIRSWFLGGFPWLFLGDAHIDTALAGFAPIFGVYGISLIMALSATVIIDWQWKAHYKSGLALIVAPWLLGPLLNQINWTQAVENAEINVVAIQGNISQERKWLSEEILKSLCKKL